MLQIENLLSFRERENKSDLVKETWILAAVLNAPLATEAARAILLTDGAGYCDDRCRHWGRRLIAL